MDEGEQKRRPRSLSDLIATRTTAPYRPKHIAIVTKDLMRFIDDKPYKGYEKKNWVIGELKDLYGIEPGNEETSFIFDVLVGEFIDVICLCSHRPFVNVKRPNDCVFV